MKGIFDVSISVFVRAIAGGALGTAMLVAASGAAHAQDGTEQPAPKPETPALTTSATVGFATDYRFRGISLNNGRETIQGSITAAHKSGFYVTAWGSAFSAVEGDSSEIALYGGYQRNIGGVGVNVGVVAYLFPEDSNLSFLEIYGSASKKFGPVTQTLGAYFAPKQDSDGVRRSSGETGSSAYYYSTTTLAVPKLPVTLGATIGYEKGARVLSQGGKVDWDLSATLRQFGLDWSIHYIGSDAPRVISFTGNNITREAVVASISKTF
ncbi:MAG: hypothetical protein E6R12_05880 [Sphingomonadales bacterium]|nr:MAG: hypothetical protein E6R12_05880 [Sphingomonadales bacterium]